MIRSLHGRLEIRNSLLVLKNRMLCILASAGHHQSTLDALICEMVKCFSTLEEEFRLSKLSCNILYFPGSSILSFVMFKIENTKIPVSFTFKNHSIHFILRVF